MVPVHSSTWYYNNMPEYIGTVYILISTQNDPYIYEQSDMRQMVRVLHVDKHDNPRTAPCERRHLRMSSLQTGFRSEYVRRPRYRFLARSSRGSRSSASASPIPSAQTLGSRAATERVDLELGESCGDGKTLTSLRKIFVVLLLLRGGNLVLHSLLETYLWCLLDWWNMRLRVSKG